MSSMFLATHGNRLLCQLFREPERKAPQIRDIKRRELDGLFAHLQEMNRNASEHKEMKRYILIAIKTY